MMCLHKITCHQEWCFPFVVYLICQQQQDKRSLKTGRLALVDKKIDLISAFYIIIILGREQSCCALFGECIVNVIEHQLLVVSVKCVVFKRFS